MIQCQKFYFLLMKIRFLHYIACLSIGLSLILGGIVTVYAEESPPQLSPFNFEDFTDDQPASGASASPAGTNATPPPAPPAPVDDIATGLPPATGDATRAVADDDESLSDDALAGSEEGAGESATPPEDLPGTGSSLLVLAALSGAGAYIVRRLRKT